jgi:hypothetical protein
METINGIEQPDSQEKYVKKCILTVSGNIAANTTIATNANGTYLTKTGDDLYLGANAADFNGKKVFVYVNGILQQQNGTDVIYVTAYSFRIPDQDLSAGDVIIILK